MRRTMTLLVTLAMLATMLAAPSAGAAPPRDLGGRISLLTQTPTVYPADEAFHILHGLGEPGRSEFLLEVDGFLQGRGQPYPGTKDDPAQGVYLYNFPEGLSEGYHTFEGIWYGPCKYGPGPCDKSNQYTEIHNETLTVRFLPKLAALSRISSLMDSGSFDAAISSAIDSYRASRALT